MVLGQLSMMTDGYNHHDKPFKRCGYSCKVSLCRYFFEMRTCDRRHIWALFLILEFCFSFLFRSHSCFEVEEMILRPKRQQYSSSETCSLNLVGLSLSHHGCQPKVVTATACRGTCHSRAVPEWRYEEQAVRLVNYCTCCEPMRSLKRSVTLTCPNTSRGFRVFPVAIPVQCACRPCSDGNPEAEQPYDY